MIPWVSNIHVLTIPKCFRIFVVGHYGSPCAYQAYYILYITECSILTWTRLSNAIIKLRLITELYNSIKMDEQEESQPSQICV